MRNDDLLGRLGQRIRTLRTARGWTQDVFAERCGLHRAHMGEIERGEANVTLRTLQIVAATLKTTLRELLKNCE